MPNGNSPQDTPSQPQPPKTSSGNDGDQQRTPKNAPQSPALSFAPAASPSGPQSPNYQIQQLVMSRNPATGQNVNITLQNVGPVVAGSQQITLTPLPIPNPASPGFQFSSQPRRFEHGSPSYIQVTSPMPQPVQTQSPTLPNAVPIQALQGVRTGTAGAGLGMCSQSPTRGFVDANLLVRQISLGPSSTGHFVFQEGSGIAQITQGAQVHLPSATPTTVPARTLQHSNSQTVGPVHQFGSQSPVVGGANLQTLTTPSHITTTNLQPQISSIIQGQLIQQQKLLHGQQLGRTISFDRASGGMVAGVAGASAFGIASPPTPTSPSRAAGPQGLSSLPLTPTVKKQSKKLEEVPPATQEDARMRKQCLELHHKHVKVLKENLKEYLIELFFLQHFQGNMMDFLAFKKKPTMGLQGYLRQSDLDLEDEDGEKKSSHISHNQPLDGAASPVIECPIAMETQASDKQKATQIERFVKRSPDSSQQEFGYQHPKVTPVVPPLPPTPGRPGAMPPSQQTAQPAGYKQSDAIKSPPAQNAASLQTASRAQAPNPTISSSLPPATQVAPLQSAELPTQVKRQPPGSPTLLSVQQLLDQPSSLKPPSMLASASKLGSEAGKLTVPGSINAPPSSPTTPATPANIPESTPPAANVSPKRVLSPGGSKAVSPSASKSPSGAGAQPQDTRSLASDTGGIEQEAAAVHKPPDQENQVHQRIAELRKEGLWSLRRLPKLQEASRPKSHWDYLLEEMQWMAADFAQERMWKVASAKKLVRTAARHHEEKKVNEQRARKEQQSKLRRIAASIAREIEYFWSNIEQVVEIKLQMEFQEKRRKALNLNMDSMRGPLKAIEEACVKYEQGSSKVSSAWRKRKMCSSRSDGEVDDEEETIAEQETKEGSIDHQAELSELAREAHLSLDDLVKKYEGAYDESFHWPRTSSQHEDERRTSHEMEEPTAESFSSQKHTVLIDSLLSIDQYRTADRASTGHLGSRKHTRDISEVARTAELLLPRGSARITSAEWGEPNCFNVCITSYKQLFKGHQAFMKMRWKYLVLDEVQQIRNMTEKHWEAVFNLPSQRRLLLRDTPLQNTLMDLWTMVHFLIPGISKAYLDFPVKASSEENQDYCHKLVIRLHRTVQPFILRRSKRDVEKQLTKKYEHVLKCRLSNRQRALYEDVILQPGTQDALKGGHFVSVLHVLMQLQRICNHPELVDPRPARSSYVCDALQYNTASLILQALAYDPWKKADLFLFDLLGMENKMTRYEAQVLPGQKVTRKLIEEIYSSPEPALRPNPVKMKPSRLFQPVLYGQKPDGRTVTFPSAPAARVVTTTTATVTQQGQARGRSSITTASSHQGGEVVKIAQLAAGGAQGRIAQPETPVTLQFQGNKFTLSQSQLRQLTAGQPLQLQGSVLQIVSAPGQQYLRPPGPVAMQTGSQGGPIENAMNALGNQHPVTMSNAAAAPQTGIQGRNIMPNSGFGDPAAVLKSSPGSANLAQELAEEKQRVMRERLDRLFSCNERRCGRAPLYGADLLSVCSLGSAEARPPISNTHWGWTGSMTCLLSSRSPEGSSDPLRHLILSPDRQKAALEPLAKRALCVVPAVVAAPPALSVAHPPPSYTHGIKILCHGLREQAAPYLQHLREKTSPHCVQFPDLRLIQCDSGKLEALVILLRKLRSEGRRVLIFSQMLLMLDILDLFLDLHSLTFLRIDEFANYEQCHDLMKSFNRDPRIFCVLLSTHSHSLGVPYVEADTVIFYDSDLNPVMDARAQAWCNRIGRTKDIHIYRLVSGNSVEEKLLKNGTKDLIREVAAQGNDFSMAFLTQQTIHELFELYSPLEDPGFGVKAEEFVMLSQEPSPAETIAPKFAKPFIEALNSIEHGGEADTEARTPEARGGHSKKAVTSDGCYYNEEPSELKQLAAVVKQLTPIEKYALNYLEEFYTSSTEEKMEIVEQWKTTKKEWETRQLKEEKEWEERMVWEEGEEELLTYTREDAYNKEFIYDSPDGPTEIMPIWTPPTPPQDENDIYIDSVMCLMYDTNPILESKLPPVYVRKERKRHKTDPAAAGRKKKLRHGESVVPPRSLFDRATPGMLKVRREGKEQKKNILLKQQTQFAKPLPTLVKPATETGPDNPEWLISEDWALLQAVKHLLELPLNLTIVSPAHTPNWDLVSDVVNSCSRIYRSSKQCRSRYENVIIPREEGKLMFEANPKKKTKSIYKTKNSRPLRTSQIHAQDEGVTHTQLYTSRFELMKMTAGKRSPPIKPLLGMNPFQKNPKHASVLAESGINYDKPLPPIQVASLRAERIAKEKKALVEQHHRAQQQSGPQAQQQPQQNGQQASSPAVQQAQAQPPQQVVQQQVGPQPQAVAAATTVPTTAVLAGTIKTAVTGTSIQTATVSGNVIVNTVAGVPSATFQPINKRLAPPVIPGTLAAPGGSPAQVAHAQQRAVATSATPAEMVTIATNQGVRAVTPVTGGAVVCSSLTPVQTQARSIVTQVTTATTAGVQLAGKTITQAQFQLLRQQQAAQVQVPQIQAQTQSTGQTKTVGKISQEQLLKLQKQKMQLPQQTSQAAAQPQQGAPQVAPVQGQQPQQQTQQLSAVTAPRAGAVLTGTTVANLQVARLLQAQGQIQAQSGQTAQVALAKSPVVSAVVSSAGVTTLPVTVAGISVAIGQPQKAAGGQSVVTQPLNVQQLLKLKQQQQQQQQQKVLQSQGAPGQATVQQKITAQQVTVQAQQQSQPQKVTYSTQPAIKTQFLTTPITQAQKPPGAQQVQAQIQVAKLPQVVQQPTTVANIQQMVSASQQIQSQTVTLTQTTAAGQQQVQVIPAGSAAAQVVQQKLLHQQQVVTAASSQIQAPASQSMAPAPGTAETQNPQAKLQVRTPTVRIKAPTKPS
ncbi:hypothetical protein FKM82_005176 [Ascaphus truei]